MATSNVTTSQSCFTCDQIHTADVEPYRGSYTYETTPKSVVTLADGSTMRIEPSVSVVLKAFCFFKGTLFALTMQQGDKYGRDAGLYALITGYVERETICGTNTIGGKLIGGALQRETSEETGINLYALLQDPRAHVYFNGPANNVCRASMTLRFDRPQDNLALSTVILFEWTGDYLPVAGKYDAEGKAIPYGETRTTAEGKILHEVAWAGWISVRDIINGTFKMANRQDGLIIATLGDELGNYNLNNIDSKLAIELAALKQAAIDAKASFKARMEAQKRQ